MAVAARGVGLRAMALAPQIRYVVSRRTEYVVVVITEKREELANPGAVASYLSEEKHTQNKQGELEQDTTVVSCDGPAEFSEESVREDRVVQHMVPGSLKDELIVETLLDDCGEKPENEDEDHCQLKEPVADGGLHAAVVGSGGALRLWRSPRQKLEAYAWARQLGLATPAPGPGAPARPARTATTRRRRQASCLPKDDDTLEQAWCVAVRARRMRWSRAALLTLLAGAAAYATWTAGCAQVSGSSLKVKEAVRLQQPLSELHFKKAATYIVESGWHPKEASTMAMDALQQFMLLDSGGDGVLSQLELVPELFGQDGTYDRSMAEEAYHEMDVNGDGVVSFMEWLANEIDPDEFSSG